MNREERASIPSKDEALSRMHSIISGIQRSAEYGNLDVNHAKSELQSVLTNLERLQGEFPEDQLKSTILSVTDLYTSIDKEHIVQAKRPRLDITTANSFGRGRDRLDIDPNDVKRLMDLGFTVKHIADEGLLGGVVHPNTIYQRLKENATPASAKYSVISDEDLRKAIQDYNINHPNSGAEEICAYLKTQGLTIQRDRCRQILSDVDSVGTATRWSKTVQRRQYSVPMANSLWHIDSHHSMIRWNIVVHGGIDGKSRLITHLRAATCNTSKSAGHFFVEGVKKFGVPSRVRTDQGTENADIGRFMTSLRGENRGSIITGKSVHNQRIERLWRDVYLKVLHIYYQLFHYMEEQQILDINNNIHMYCLQYVFVRRIDIALQEWQMTHNNHRIRTEGNQTPQMIWFQSQLQADSTSTASSQIDSATVNLVSRQLDLDSSDDLYIKPRIQCPLSDEHSILLKDSVNINRYSDSHGLDIFRDVVNFVSGHI